MSEVQEFWSEYVGFNWQTSKDVLKFVEDALDQETYGEGSQQFDYGSDWVNCWWLPVKESIQNMVETFDTPELEKSIEHLIGPMGSVGGDCAIMDALISSGFDFSTQHSRAALDNYYSNWCEDSYVSWPFDDVQFSYCAFETIASARTLGSEILQKIFLDSFSMSEIHIIFRIRVALAQNPATPPEILTFLFDSRTSVDWLISDTESVPGGTIPILADYSIDENYVSDDDQTIDDLRSKITTYLEDGLPEYATYMISLFGEDWNPDSATECLNVAFARNTSLSEKMYEALLKEPTASVQYYLSKNSSINSKLKAHFKKLSPTFTFTYAGMGFEETIT